MNTDEFENHLRDLPRAPIPAHWREEILAAAHPAPIPSEAPAPSRQVTVWWLDWLEPTRTGWAALALAWLAIVAVNLATQTTAPASRTSHLVASAENLKLRAQMLSELVGPLAETADAPHSSPPPVTLPPRSENFSRTQNLYV